MKKASFVLLCVVLGMIGLAWRAGARGGSSLNASQVVYNPAKKVYQLQSQIQFANHSLEQKFLAIQFITRHQEQLATKNSPGPHSFTYEAH